MEKRLLEESTNKHSNWFLPRMGPDSEIGEDE